MRSQRLQHPTLLADASALSSVVGPIADMQLEPLTVPGFSGARFERVTLRLANGAERRLVLKRVRVADDFTAWRTNDDFGRATFPLEAASFGAIWEIFACPFVAHAVAEGEVGLLMDDLSAYFAPDVREPLAPAAEDALVSALASLHARFWDAPALDDPRLAPAARTLGMLGPALAHEEKTREHTAPVIERAIQGWEVAFRHLPSAIAEKLMRPAEDAIRAWGPLPRTLIHGDAKVANFAFLPDGRVAAFDWGGIGAGPAALDFGWYLAVNATRIRGTKEAFVRRYRERLEAALGVAIDEPTWTRLQSAAIESGARILLWSKALAYERGDAAARLEWEWWMDALSRG